MKQSNHRLPAHVKPSKYFLTIQPNLVDFTFSGSEIINLEIAKHTKQLVLHAVDIKIQSAKVVVGRHAYPAKVSYQSKKETVTFSFPKAIVGSAKLYIKFTGEIGEQLRGFYRSKYTHNQQKRYLATTQFEATDARRAFPCFDEPAQKAKFVVEVVVPDSQSAISNTIESSVKPHSPGYKIVRFAPTPKMSTYLLALIIGDLEHLKTKSKRGVKIRLHTTPGKKAQGKFALEFTKQALDYLENYFGIPYPLPVLDLIAIPDFSEAAMENWGAITFRESELLVDDAKSPFTQKQRVAEVIAHELVHQWFGNLVTMEWWTHLWLNESFATYMAYQVVDAIYPKWHYWTKFVLDEQAFALQQDSLHATHPIEVPVHHPNEISEIFDAISYAKGASVLRMLANYIGEENFQAGLSLYLKKHSYQNTSSVHLWTVFEKVSGLPVRKLMRTWTTKSGFPVLHASLKNGQLHLVQKEFKQLAVKKSSQRLWPIPLAIQTGKDQVGEPRLIVNQKTVVSLPADAEFINLDYLDSSLTVVNYELSLLARLLPAVQAGKVKVLDRLALVRDNFLLVKAGFLSTEVYLDTLTFLKEETSYVVWAEMAKNFAQLERLLQGTKAETTLRDFQKNLFTNLLRRLGKRARPRESQNSAILRGLALQEAGLSGNPEAKALAKQLFVKILRGGKVDPNLGAATYTVVARFGGTKEQRQLEQLHNQTNLAIEKRSLRFAMINGANNSTARAVLEFVYSDYIRDQDKPFAIAATLANPVLKDLAWDQMVRNWPSLQEKFGYSKRVGSLLSGAQSFNQPVELAKFKHWVADHKLPRAKQALAQTIEKIQMNIAWKKRDLKAITKYLHRG